MIKFLALINIYWVTFTWLAVLAITILSLWPLNDLESVPGSDKVHHLIAYAMLMFPTALRKPNLWMLYGGIYIAFSGAIELVQPYVNRYGEWEDMLANTAGVLCGLVLAEILAGFSRNHLHQSLQKDSNS